MSTSTDHTLGRLFEDVRCAECRAKLERAPRNEHGFPLLDGLYLGDDGRPTGNMANVQMGHQFVFGHDGKYALCSTRNAAAVALGGSRSTAKARASQNNGRKGGRPKSS